MSDLSLIEEREVSLAVPQFVVSWMLWVFQDDLLEGRQQINVVAGFGDWPILSQMYLSFAKIIFALGKNRALIQE
jgi:hypothetical protein